MPDRAAQHGRLDAALGWRPELSGVRAVAILLVLGSHLALPMPRGGPVGVTVFFVLSGFLITNLLIEEWHTTGSVDLRGFYVRRARRLAPALIVAVAAVAAIATAVGQADGVGRDSILALTYLSNWARAQGDLMGLWNHAWSLAIEEQFYVLWPLAFLLLLRLGPAWSARTIAIVLGLAALSAASRVLLVSVGASEERVYFGSDTRAEALLLGCAFAAIRMRDPSRGLPAGSVPAALAVIGALTLLPDEVMPWAGARYTLVSLATVMLIAGLVSPTGRRVGLGSRPMVWLGERSYSLYLWHVPVILALSGPLAEEAAIVRVAISTAVSVALAAASYTFVERPFRRRRPAERHTEFRPVTIALERSG